MLHVVAQLHQQGAGFRCPLDGAELQPKAREQSADHSSFPGPKINAEIANLELGYPVGCQRGADRSGRRGFQGRHENTSAYPSDLALIQQTGHMVIHDREFAASSCSNRVVGDHLLLGVQVLNGIQNDLASRARWYEGGHFSLSTKALSFSGSLCWGKPKRRDAIREIKACPDILRSCRHQLPCVAGPRDLGISAGLVRGAAGPDPARSRRGPMQELPATTS